MNFKTWLHLNYPLLSAISEKYHSGVCPAAAYGREIAGSWINYKHGEASDIVAAALGIEEQLLIDTLNGCYKRDLRTEYNNQYSAAGEKRFVQTCLNLENKAAEMAADALEEFFAMESADVKYRFSN